MSDKRRAERRSVRIRVRFWRPGQPDVVHQGYTTNISATGAFVQTDHPHPKGRRLQVEFTTERNGFVCEALVARAIKAAPELQNVRPSGMGLRFLSVEELLAGFLPTSKGAAGAESALTRQSCASDSTSPSSTRKSTGRPAEHRGTTSAPQSEGRTSDPDENETDRTAKGNTDKKEIEVTAAKVARHHPAAPPPRPDTAETAGRTGGAPAPEGGADEEAPLVFRLTPPSLDVVRTLFERQIRPGVLLLPSRNDCRIGRSVRVELKTPASPLGQRILSFEGEVLECGHVDSDGGSTLRVKIRENPTAEDFLRRILDTSTT